MQSLLFTFILLIVGQGTSDTLVLAATLYDQAPATMNHSRYPENYWEYDGWINNPVCSVTVVLLV
jgi:hypothetical protein